MPESEVRRVLIYRLGSLGDTVVALPCFHLIARRFPNAQRGLLTGFPIHAKAPAAAAVLGSSGLVHRYLRYTVGTRSVGELLRVAREIREFAPEVVVYLMPLRPWKSVLRDRIFLRLAGVRRIVGLPERSERTHQIDAATGLYENEAVRLARALAPLGEAHPEKLEKWDLRLTDGERQAAATALGELAGKALIVCGPGCKMHANDWGRENWRELLGRLSSRYSQYALAMAGAKQDAADCEFAAADWQGSKVNLAGKLNPRESAAVFAQAAMFLGPDSGPKHLAASVGTPCVCAFGARNLPGVWFPPGAGNQIVYHQPQCQGCGLETCIERERQCIRSISVEEMEQAAIRVLEGSLQDALVQA